MATNQEKCSHCGPCHNRKDILEKVLQRIEILLDREESLSASPVTPGTESSGGKCQDVAGDLLDHGPPVDQDLSSSQRLDLETKGPFPLQRNIQEEQGGGC